MSDWLVGERPDVPPDRSHCRKCGSLLRLVGPAPSGYDGTGAQTFDWTAQCPNDAWWKRAFMVGHDGYRFYPRRGLIGMSYDRWSGPRPLDVGVL